MQVVWALKYFCYYYVCGSPLPCILIITTVKNYVKGYVDVTGVGLIIK